MTGVRILSSVSDGRIDLQCTTRSLGQGRLCDVRVANLATVATGDAISRPRWQWLCALDVVAELSNDLIVSRKRSGSSVDHLPSLDQGS
jgi:hypothetical protein